MALVVKNLSANTGGARDAGSIPRLVRSPEEGNSNSLQYSCLENTTDRGDWRATAQGVTKGSDTTEQLNKTHNIKFYHWNHFKNYYF